MTCVDLKCQYTTPFRIRYIDITVHFIHGSHIFNQIYDFYHIFFYKKSVFISLYLIYTESLPVFFFILQGSVWCIHIPCNLPAYEQDLTE